MKYNHMPDLHRIEEEICKRAGYILIGKRSLFFSIILVSTVSSFVFSFFFSDPIEAGACLFSSMVVLLYISSYVFAGSSKKYRRKAEKIIIREIYQEISKVKEILERKKNKVPTVPETQTEEGRRKIIFDESNPLRNILMDVGDLEKYLQNLEKTKSFLTTPTPQKNPMF